MIPLEAIMLWMCVEDYEENEGDEDDM